MDSQEILGLALHLANQSEVPADTTINVPARDVRKVLFGIDVDAADLLFAKEKGYDLVIAHHPTGGSAVLGLPEVFAKHASILTSHGVPKEAADAAVREMQEEREPRVHAENYDHLPSMARMIGIGLMCIHNPCDEIGRRLMDEALRAQLPEKPRVRDAVAVLESMPEFRSALTHIVVRMGTTDHPLGKWAVHHGAGTNGGVPVARAAFDHGIDTVSYIDIDDVALLFLTQIGYIPKGYDPKTDASSVRDSVPYRLFVECLLGRMDKGWTVEQLAAKLKTTKATIYRHINKLKEMDLLDEVNVNERGTIRKGYRIRYGNLSKAWNFVESNVEIAMENYRKTVDHLAKLAEQRR